MLQRLLALIAALAAISAVSSSAARADQRVALVIGVAAYDEAEPLLNPVRDAEAVAARFRSLGYETRLFLNASRAEMTAALAALGKGEGALDQAVIYFAGHGVQVDGANDLLPADWAADRPLDETGLSLREIARAAAGAARQTIF
ncbi:MAG: caspase family protein, partial [Pseudomonadota bacterium]